jgi:hypothetical protein
MKKFNKGVVLVAIKINSENKERKKEIQTAK